ncbi:hypothetical protein [Photorhabdus laumondii]|nr:hypothetical protein [Photorhabdus laumondii]
MNLEEQLVMLPYLLLQQKLVAGMGMPKELLLAHCLLRLCMQL